MVLFVTLDWRWDQPPSTTALNVAIMMLWKQDHLSVVVVQVENGMGQFQNAIAVSTFMNIIITCLLLI